MRHWGIQGRVLFLALVPTSVIVLVLAYYFAHTRLDDLERALREHGQDIAARLAQTSEHGMLSGNQDIVRAVANAALNDPDVAAITIRNTKGAPLVSLTATARTRPDRGPLPPQKIAHTEPTVIFSAPILRTDIPVEARNIRHRTVTASYQGNQVLGWVTVQLSRASTVHKRAETLLTTLLIALTGLLVSTIIAYRMGLGITRPIMVLNRAVKKLERGEFDIDLNINDGAELGELARGVNAMVVARKSANEDLEDKIYQATAELRKTLETIEVQNLELECARERALEASRVKSEFLANMSHEMRTPMHAILGYTNLLLKTGINDEQRDQIHTIQKSAASLLILINDILDIAKIEAGKIALQDLPFNPGECIEDVLSLLAPTAHDKDLELVSLVYNDVPCRLMGDPVRLRQIVTNLVGNAVKFTASGSVVIRTMLEDEAEDHVMLRITVTDTGPGITPDDQQRLFSTFTQLDKPNGRRHNGTGLGLAISRSLVAHLGGDIGVDSTQGQGSTFWLTARFRREHTGVIAPQPWRGRRALIYDAHDTTRLALRHLLHAGGMEIIETGDGQQLAELASHAATAGQPLDVILLGASCAQIRQRWTLSWIAAVGTRCPVPIVVLANTSDFETLQRLRARGAAACLSKPVRQQELTRTLNALFKVSADQDENSQDNVAFLTGLNILVVDDNLINRRLAVALLTQWGAQVETVDSGPAAIDAVTHHTYDIILMDMHMPGMSGSVAAAHIRANLGGARHTPIVALTASAPTVGHEEASAAGLDALLTKPIQEDALRRAIARCLPFHTALSATSHHADAPNKHTALADEMLNLLINDLPTQKRALAESLARNDWENLQIIAHRLHGSASCCNVPAIKTAAAKLEQILLQSEVEAVPAAVENINAEIDRLMIRVPLQGAPPPDLET